jgi:hypothetical protein
LFQLNNNSTLKQFLRRGFAARSYGTKRKHEMSGNNEGYAASFQDSNGVRSNAGQGGMQTVAYST